MIVAGIDPSLTSAGVAVLRDGHPTVLASPGHSCEDASDWGQQSRRIVSQANAVMEALGRKTWATEGGKPDLAVIEGPAWSRNLPSSHARAGLWWGIYSALIAKGVHIPVAIVTPTCRSKWATGHGRAPKATVVEHVQTTWADWKHRITNDDIADALTLAEMGARWLGEPLPFEPRRRHVEGLAAVTWPEVVGA